MTRRAIVAVPALPPEPIGTLRRRYDPLAERVPPHLTLVFPFESALPADVLRRHVAAAVGGCTPFPVQFAVITGSEGEYLFLNVKRGNATLIALHDRLYSGILHAHRSLAHTYLPHITIGRLADHMSFQQALTDVSSLNVSLESTITAATVYRLEPDGERLVESVVRLGPGETGCGAK